MQTKKDVIIQSVQKITDCRHLNMFKINYQDMAGQERIWRIVSRTPQPKCVTGRFDIPDAVIIVPFHIRQNKLVIIKEFRVSLGCYQYGFPAGLVDQGESVDATAARELYEETGLTLISLFKVSPPIYSSSGLTDESISMAYVYCSGEPSTLANATSEDILTLLVSPEEAADLCDDPKLKFDAKTWLILSEYARNGKVF